MFSMPMEAMFYEKESGGAVRCHLCPHNCLIKPGGNGVCRVRHNKDGVLYTMNYGKVTSAALDPIEKKPLHRYKPGSYILSIGTYGCNFKCPHCQNWTIAHTTPSTVDMTPGMVAKKAVELVNEGNIGVAYTYNEPFIWYEFVYDTCREVKKNGLSNVLVTNGFVNRKPLEKITPFIDAMNIDVKAFTEEFYHQNCRGSLRKVKETIEYSARHCHVEITTLVIPGLNDEDEEMKRLSEWLASISPDITLHLSRFFPNYRMKDRPPTPLATLKRLKEIASRQLMHVYLGNV
jgi:pyruvate formate lyase activating enzyme